MKKVINSNIVAANAFLTTEEDVLDVELIKLYVDKVREKTNYKTNYFIGSFDPTIFAHQFDFAFVMDKTYKYIYLLTEMQNKRVLKGYFRQNLPKNFIKILKETGQELLIDEANMEIKKEEKKKKQKVKTK